MLEDFFGGSAFSSVLFLGKDFEGSAILVFRSEFLKLFDFFGGSDFGFGVVFLTDRSGEDNHGF